MRNATWAPALLLLAACSRGAPAEPETPAVVVATQTVTEIAQASSPAEQQSSSASPEEASEGSGMTASAAPTASPSGFRPLTIEQRHPNGSLMRISGISVEETSVTLQVEVINGQSDAITLAYAGGTVRLDDDAGNTYEFIPPADNEDLAIQGRGTLTGELVFYGVFDPRATSLHLQTSASEFGALEDVDVEGQSASETLLVVFDVDIPLQG